MVSPWLLTVLRRYAASLTGLLALGAANYPSRGRAQADPPPQITLRVEQPAYAGLPVWLHVVTKDECFEDANPTYPWYRYLWLRDDGAEVTQDGQAVARIPFKDFDPAHHIRIPDEIGCSTRLIAGPEHDHRFALSGLFIFDKPGVYKVRWTTRTNDLEHVRLYDQSEWVVFTVMAASDKQRKDWLAAMLPAGALLPELGADTNVIYDYIPSLMSAWQNPRVAQKFIDLACNGPKDVSIAAAEALQFDMTSDAAAYFANKLTDGCLWDDRFMPGFIQRHAGELTGVRSQLLRGLAAHFDVAHAEPTDLQNAMGAIASVRVYVPGDATAAAVNAQTDANIVRVAPLFTSLQHGSERGNYTQGGFGNLVAYLSHEHLSPAEHALLRAMAADGIFGLDAFEALVALKNPDDLVSIGTTLGNLPPGQMWNNYLTDLDGIVANFGDRAIPMLRIVAANANEFTLRDNAASHLVALGQPEGQVVLANSVHSTYWVEQRNAARVLDELLKSHVAIGDLKAYCTSADPADPCGVKAITTPPGKCEPRVACTHIVEDKSPERAPPQAAPH